MVTSPMLDVALSVNTGFQVVPAFTDFQTPPDAAATKTVAGFASTASMSVTRPAMFAGPMLRHLRSFSSASTLSGCETGDWAAGRYDARPTARTQARRTRTFIEALLKSKRYQTPSVVLTEETGHGDLFGQELAQPFAKKAPCLP